MRPIGLKTREWKIWDQLIDAANVAENVRNCGQIPAKESQTRPLTPLPPTEQREAWQKAVETAPEGKVTARRLENVIRETKGKPAASQKREKPPIWVGPGA